MLPNPGSGLDAVRLANGHLAVDLQRHRPTGASALAVSISDDEGAAWRWTRHAEKQESGSFHYPTVVQGADGMIHAVYSYFVAGLQGMKHAAFNEEWVQAKRSD